MPLITSHIATGFYKSYGTLDGKVKKWFWIPSSPDQVPATELPEISNCSEFFSTVRSPKKPLIPGLLMKVTILEYMLKLKAYWDAPSSSVLSKNRRLLQNSRTVSHFIVKNAERNVFLLAMLVQTELKEAWKRHVYSWIFRQFLIKCISIALYET